MTSGHEVEEVVDAVSELLHRRIGLRPEPDLRGRLRRCIRDAALGQGQDLSTFLDTLFVDGEALQGLVNRVTVQETAFFRHPEQFELLVRQILPGLDPPVTAWSAACANGQEAFSLAMLLEEEGIDGRVIATDLSTDALKRTNAARYSARELSGLSADRIARHLSRDGDAWLVNDTIRRRVSTLQHNLIQPIPHEVRACQVIFCRNVLIYFSPDRASAFLDQVADALPTASLFLGGAETIWQLTDRFETVRSGDAFSYRRRADVTRSRRDPHRREGSPDHQSSPAAVFSGGRPGGVRDTAWPPPKARRPATPRAGANANPVDTSRSPARSTPAVSAPPPAAADDLDPAVLLARAGQQASAIGDVQAAVVAFRKCAYLAPADPMAHLHLALALDSAGDQRSALRAYAAARHALTLTDPAQIDDAIGGYTTADLIRLLDSKQKVIAP